MIIPDINLLIYAYDASSPFHAKAAAWWRSCLSGSEAIGLLPVVVFGFVRLSTSARAFANPMTSAESAECVRAWLDQTPVELLQLESAHVARVLDLLEKMGVGANLVTDAQIAVAALEHNATVHTADADFARIENLRWLNPLTNAGSADQRRNRRR
jgi:toxin-antitoxin system PIN domain toxin